MAERAAKDQFEYSIATSPPTLRQRRLASLLVVVTLAAFGAVASFANLPLQRFDSFIPAVAGIIFVADLVTAVLLFSQFSAIGSRALLVLAAGYLFTSLIAIPFALTFPGAFAPTGLLGAGDQSAAWLSLSMRIGFAVAALGYALLTSGKHANGSIEPSPRPAILWSVAIVTIAVCALIAAATTGHDFMPRLLDNRDRVLPFVHYAMGMTALTYLLALLLLWSRQKSVLDLWLMVAVCALIAEAVSIALLPAGRFNLGFYANRVIPVVVSKVVLIMLLSETVLLHAKRREHEAILSESERRLQTALKAGRVMAFDWDVRNDLLQLSENAGQILGIDPKRNATAADFLERIHPDDRLGFNACVSNLRPDNPSYDVSYRYLRLDGQEVWLKSTGRAEFDKAGQIVRIRGLRADITERVLTENELVEARKTAEHANRAKSSFLAAASHDLRQPLQTMKILQWILAQQIHDSAASKSIVGIGRSLETMSDMLNSLLDINQLESGTLRPSTSDFLINDVFDELAAAFLEPAEEKGLQWRWVRSRLTVHSDRRLLRAMIRNLLSNAIRYTDRGGILVGCRRAGDKVRIEVWDSGVGIVGAQMPHIFEEHYQGPQSAQLGGFGLGLAIVQRLGNMLGHQIAARSTPGKGSIFSIEVPLGRDLTKESVQTELPPGRSNTRISGTILVIEDEGSVRDALRLWLRSQGLDVASVADGTEALTLINKKGIRPDLVLSDYNLPGPLNGIETVHALREALTWKVPAIILTGDTQSHVTDVIAKHGFAFAVKPVNADQLKELVVTLLGASKAIS